MYVQINEDVKNQLNDNTICTMLMGSHAHALNNGGSDIDFLSIYHQTNVALFSEDNGWQYKTNVCDYNYQSLRTFIRNVIKGDSPADFEALMGGWKFAETNTHYNTFHDIDRVDSIFNILRTNRSYALIKSYLGYVKKDGKYIQDTLAKSTMQTREICNKLSHMYRGVETAKILINNEEYVFCYGYNSDMRWQRAWAYKNIAGTVENIDIINIVSELMSEYESLKTELNKLLDAQKIVRRFELDKLHDIELIYNKIEQFGEIDFGKLNHEITEKG